ncbi:alpha/beta fold hydrolase [Clostridium bovifaecis]|uniref:Alpha/beta fold hydrolase n=1 Tax=Clostridium bovifaecis TaxID=2184719 RepID=A0A6I6ETC0_9CLOT|nr:alpha/beta fold hydrolase [Clostridium bovifaecis]
MIETNFTFKSKDGLEIFTYKWMPEEGVQPRAVIQIAHGMGETARRYKEVGERLTNAGYIVYADDHRGHGQTAKEIDKLGEMGDDSFNLMVDDMYQLTQIIKKENSELPVFLLGHSMGSFLTQRYICLHGKELRGVILSGSNGSQGIIANIGSFIANREVKKIGRNSKSAKMAEMTFGGFNKGFAPCRTDFDWLTRDEKEVDKYIEDPSCGFGYTAGFYCDLLQGLKLIARKEEINKVPKELPIFIFSGDKDPVGGMGKGVLKLINAYKKAGIKSVEYKLYKDGRHEMFNEINRDEVIENLILWLETHI